MNVIDAKQLFTLKKEVTRLSKLNPGMNWCEVDLKQIRMVYQNPEERLKIYTEMLTESLERLTLVEKYEYPKD